jgi:hypothetical protein
MKVFAELFSKSDPEKGSKRTKKLDKFLIFGIIVCKVPKRAPKKLKGEFL